ncbi:hypothetical protein AB0M28_00550 [Streptomyces sp. NPDC051940]|uniref:hypothetical protein n=1 Tax=Streptomyces sp. NPDC051940 TaxID=3155675 RepID=UPI003420F26F
MRLPPHLAPWAAQLALLDTACATALGPVVRGVDALLGGEPHTARPHGEHDGYDGLTNRGHPERLLMSEWLLAEEAPEEFLRRAAQRELLHLAPAHKSRARRGRIAVLADTGPSQLGAARLVQLAALLVAHRRAEARGAGLLLGVLGGQPGAWHDGELPGQLSAWLGERSPFEPDPLRIADWAEGLDRDDELWILAGGPLAAHPAVRRHRVLRTAEAAWSDAGATAVTARLDGHEIRLPLPEPAVSVRILRGDGWRRATPMVPRALPGAGDGPLVFPGNGPRLAIGSYDPPELVTVALPREPDHAVHALPRRHPLPGRPLAACQYGRRLLVLVRTGPYLRLHTVGRPLPVADEFQVTARDLYPDDHDAAELEPLLGDEYGLLLRRAGTWWRLRWQGRPTEAPEILWALPGEAPREVNLAHRPGSQAAGMRIVLGPQGTYAWSPDGREWRFSAPDGDHPASRRSEAGEVVHGAVLLAGHAHLVTRSAAGQLLRLRGPVRDAVLTRWSGSPDPPAVHPSRPLVAVRRPSGSVEVGDVLTGKPLLVLRGRS